MSVFTSIDDVQNKLSEQGYVCSRALATVVFLSLKLGRPLFLEGEAGVGKTEIAKVLAAALATTLIRLQCYEGLDAAAALYEWNYAKQILRIRLDEQSGRAADETDKVVRDLFSQLARRRKDQRAHGFRRGLEAGRE